MTEEIWKPIVGYEGRYEVSNAGNVRSVSRTVSQLSPHGNEMSRRMIGKVLSPMDNGNGYMVVHLRKGTKRQPRYVHRLVAEAFIQNPKAFPEVDHIDSNRKNNKAENLRWVTHLQNMKNAIPNMCHPKRTKPGATGEKYISYKDGRYRFNVWGKIDKRFRTLEEAISAREVFLSDAKHYAG